MSSTRTPENGKLAPDSGKSLSAVPAGSRCEVTVTGVAVAVAAPGGEASHADRVRITAAHPPAETTAASRSAAFQRAVAAWTAERSPVESSCSTRPGPLASRENTPAPLAV